MVKNLRKVRCAITGEESDWYESNRGQLPVGWGTVTISILSNNRQRYSVVDLTVSPSVTSRLTPTPETPSASVHEQLIELLRELIAEEADEIING